MTAEEFDKKLNAIIDAFIEDSNARGQKMKEEVEALALEAHNVPEHLKKASAEQAFRKIEALT